MTKYIYRARDGQGKLVEGVVKANSSREVVAALHEQSLIAVSIEQVKEGKIKERGKTRKEVIRRKQIKIKDISIFCRQMSTMINAGVSVVEAVEDISAMSLNARFKSILKMVVNDIKSGSSLSEALSEHKSVFSKVFISMVRAGEESGNLDIVLHDLSTYLEAEVKLKGQVKSASMYPAFIGSFFALTITGLVLFLVPRFKKLFVSMGAELPLPTKLMMTLSDIAIKNFHWFLLFVIAVFVGLMLLYKTKPGRYMLDKLLLALPLFGILITKAVLARFFQTLATLLRSGVDIVASLEIAGKVINNLPAEQIVDEIRYKIMEGSSLSAEMGRHSFFPSMTVRMTSIGEKSGKIDEMLEKVAEYYTDEVDAAVEGLSSIIEPVLIVVLGGVVGVFVVTMYLPVFKMATAMMGGH